MNYLMLFEYYYAPLYHLLDFDKLRFLFENGYLTPYRAPVANTISSTRNKMMNSYLGDKPTTFFKLELDSQKIKNNFKIKSFKDRGLIEYEELIKLKKDRKLDKKYINKLILIKSRIEKMKNPSFRDSDIPSDYFTNARTTDRTIPYMIKYIVENSPFEIYVQEGSVIKKDDKYIQSLIDYELHNVDFKYDVWYRVYLPSDRHKYAKTDTMIDSGGTKYKEWVVGKIYDIDGKNLKDKKEIDYSIETKTIVNGDDYTDYIPYLMKFRKTSKGWYLEDTKPLDWTEKNF